MKVLLFLVLSFTFVCSPAWSAIQTVSTMYEVPVTPDLIAHSKFPMDVEIASEDESNQVTIRYSLPEILTGNTNVMEFTGTQKKNDRYILEGTHGKAKCEGSAVCEIEYTAAEMNLNWAGTEAAINLLNVPLSEKQALLRVACSFHADPFGIIHFENPVFRYQKRNTLANQAGCAQVK